MCLKYGFTINNKINIVNAGRKRKRRWGTEHEHAYETEFKVHLFDQDHNIDSLIWKFSFLKKCYCKSHRKKCIFSYT